MSKDQMIRGTHPTSEMLNKTPAGDLSNLHQFGANVQGKQPDKNGDLPDDRESKSR